MNNYVKLLRWSLMIKSLGILLLIISCNPDERVATSEEPAPCETCENIRQESLNLLVENNADTLLLMVLDGRFQPPSQVYGLCVIHDSLFQILEDELVISAMTLIYDQCEEGQYVELLTYKKILHCRPEVDTTSLPGDPSDIWRIQRFNDTFIPCELEPNYLRPGALADDSASGLSVFGMVASTRIKGDSIFLFDHLETTDLEATSNGQLFRSQLSGFFNSAIPDTTKLLFSVERNFLIFRNPVTGTHWLPTNSPCFRSSV